MDEILGIPHDDREDGCPTDPDVAGIGVIVSCVLAALLTTLASITAAILDEILMADTAFLPKKVNRLFSKDQNPEENTQMQLVTGFSLMLTGWIVYYDDLKSAHFALIVYLSCLSSSSHLAAIVTLRKYFEENQTLALFRIAIKSLFALLLSVSISLTSAFGPFYLLVYVVTGFGLAPPGIGIILSIMPILWTFWTGIWQIMPTQRARFQAWLRRKVWPKVKHAGLRRCWSWIQRVLSERNSQRLKRYFWSTLTYGFFLSPMTVFLIQVLFAIISVSMAIAQKFSPGDKYECSLNSGEENEMGYGQVLAILLLVLPAIATFEAYKEEERKVRMEEAREGLQPLPAIVHKVVLSSSELALQSEVRITNEQVRAIRNIMDGQWTEARNFCSASRRDTEQRVGDRGDSATSSTTVTFQGPEEGMGTITRRGTWDADV